MEKKATTKKKLDYWIQPKNLKLIKDWALSGATTDDMAKAMGIGRSTFFEWCNKSVELMDAIKTTKDFADITIENALYKRAKGFTTVEITKEYGQDELNQKKLISTKEVIKEVPPETTAIIFWLKNRKKEDWRDKWELNATVTNYEDRLRDIIGDNDL